MLQAYFDMFILTLSQFIVTTRGVSGSMQQRGSYRSNVRINLESDN